MLTWDAQGLVVLSTFAVILCFHHKSHIISSDINTWSAKCYRSITEWICWFPQCMYYNWTTKGHTSSFFLQTPTWFSSLCISGLKSAARNESITNLQLAHSEEHHPQVEKVLTCLLTDLSAEERSIRRGRCTLESALVCPCIKVLPISESDCAMLGLVVMVGVLLQCTVCGISVFEFLLYVVHSIHITTYCLPAVHELNSWTVLLWYLCVQLFSSSWCCYV